MKTFNRTYLPDEIKYNGKTYRKYADKNEDFVTVKVLQSILKGKTDLHGQPYKPTTHKLYVS